MPTPGGPGDFPRLVQLIASGAAARGSAGPARALWAIRLKLGKLEKLLGWDDGPQAGPGPQRPSLRDRLPADLRAGPRPRMEAVTALYLTADEWAAEIVNRTVHGIFQLGWVADGSGRYHGQLAVYVKPNGLPGAACMVAIKPFRHLIVYQELGRQVARAWPVPARVNAG